MAIETIQAINNPTFKTGTGKNGKEWTMMQITTDQNNVASVFAPAAVGDKVETTWNDQYGSWSAKKVTGNSMQGQKLDQIYALLQEIHSAVVGKTNNTKNQLAEANEPLQQVTLPPTKATNVPTTATPNTFSDGSPAPEMPDDFLLPDGVDW